MWPEYRTRFAPSPTGLLHLGHAYSAITAYERAQAMGGTFLLRIEDIDTSRCHAEYEVAIARDLAWLGLDWPRPVWRQSERAVIYASALNQLISLGVCYPCSCTRGEIRAALSAPQEGVAPQSYPGTCRVRAMADAGPNDAIRLNMDRALGLLPQGAGFVEDGPMFTGRHPLNADAMRADPGDVVLARRDIGTSYNIAVVVDDAAQGVTEVVRGADLFEATFVQVLLQNLLELLTPSYWHHALVRDDAGKRLAKRDDARAIARYRDEGLSPGEVIALARRNIRR
jgi:glutamyl-Q tRNA(Asp) synthetase